MPPNGPRDDYAGPESGPEPPFPIKLRGPVIKGFGRGSKELGIPTANIPPEGLSAYPDLTTGIYFGYTSLLHPPSSAPSASSNGIITSPTPATPDTTSHTFSSTIDAGEVQIYPCVLSIGYNPFYNNTTRSIEIHILHKFADDFYGSSLNLLLLGFIRPEYDYVSKESLIEDIMTDCRVAERSLKREGWRIDDGSEADANSVAKTNEQRRGWEAWLREFGWAMGMTDGDVAKVEREVLGSDGASSTYT